MNMRKFMLLFSLLIIVAIVVLLFLFHRSSSGLHLNVGKGKYPVVIISLPELKPICYFDLPFDGHPSYFHAIATSNGEKLAVLGFGTLSLWRVSDGKSLGMIVIDTSKYILDDFALNVDERKNRLWLYSNKEPMAFSLDDLESLKVNSGNAPPKPNYQEIHGHDDSNKMWNLEFEDGGNGNPENFTVTLIDKRTGKIATIWQVTGPPHGADAIIPEYLEKQGRWIMIPAEAIKNQSIETTSSLPLGCLELREEGKNRKWRAHLGAMYTGDMDRQGRFLATGGQDWKAKLWDLPSGKLLYTIEAEKKPVTCVRLSSDGAKLATINTNSSKIRIWDTFNGKIFWEIPVAKKAPKDRLGITFQWHPSEPWLLVPVTSGIQIWDTNSRTLKKTLNYGVDDDRAIAWDPTGQHLAVLLKREIKILDAFTFEERKQLMPINPRKQDPDQEGCYTPFRLGQIQWSTDGKLLWWRGMNPDFENIIEWGIIWDITSGEIVDSGKALVELSNKWHNIFAKPRLPYFDWYYSSQDKTRTLTGVGFGTGDYLDIHPQLEDEWEEAQEKENNIFRQAILDGNGPSGEYPRFRDYPVQEVYNGPSAQLDMQSQLAKEFKTRFREALAGGKVSCAGEYISTGWGAGMGCVISAFVNKRTGVVVADVIGGESGEEIVGMDVSSRLVISKGPELDNHLNRSGYYAYFYELAGDRLKLIKKVNLPKPLIDQ